MIDPRFRAALRRTLPARPLIWTNAHRHYFWGEPELKLLRSLVPRNRMSIDIGANTGVYSYWLAQLSPSVVAYEPNGDLVRFLKAGLPANVAVVQIALSDHGGFENLVIPIIDGAEIHGWASLAGQHDKEQTRTIRVPVGRLDDQGHGDVGFIKIDVEGHEQAVLDGATETISRCRPVLLIEIEQRHTSKDIREFIAGVVARGYRGRFLNEGRLAGVEEFRPDVHQRLENADRGRQALYINNFLFEPIGA